MYLYIHNCIYTNSILKENLKETFEMHYPERNYYISSTCVIIYENI